MPFKPDHFIVGMIAYYTVNQLKGDGRILTLNTSLDRKVRPFVCYAEDDGMTYWTCLTSKKRQLRDTVDARWLRVPVESDTWGDRINISHGRSNWVGPIKVFAELSDKHDRWEGMRRPFLFGEGLEQLRRIVAARHGLMPSRQTIYRRAA